MKSGWNSRFAENVRDYQGYLIGKTIQYLTDPEIISLAGYAIEAVGVFVIVLGSCIASIDFARTFRQLPEGIAYLSYRRQLGRSIILGLEFLIAGDIIRTVVVADTFENVAVLGLIILIRSFLSVTLHLEVEGRWPWQAGGTRPLAEVLRQLRPSLGHKTSVLVIAPLGAPTSRATWIDALLPLTRAGRAPSVVLLDAASFAGAGRESGEGDAVEGARALLTRAGVPVHVIRQGHPFPAPRDVRRRGYWEFKTSPLGRAVLVRRPEEG